VQVVEDTTSMLVTMSVVLEQPLKDTQVVEAVLQLAAGVPEQTVLLAAVAGPDQ
jgi:hypothetical protein